MDQIQMVINKLNDRYWRLSHLYSIIDKSGDKIPFQMNWAQEELYNNIWYCNVILKARQLGISTFITILFLDTCLFNSNVSCGIIAHTREDAEQIFAKAKLAFDSLPEELKQERSAKTDNVREFHFSNGSQFRVGVSMRSSTFQYLHISEFGKICAKYPDKAREIITGSLNTLAQGQYIFIESTAEGREGYFYDLCEKSRKDIGKKLSPMDYRFHFFPWWKDLKYQSNYLTEIEPELKGYFETLANKGINLSQEQKNWYVLKKKFQKEDMFREYPSIPEEAFWSSMESSYYGKEFLKFRQEGRIGSIPYDPYKPCFTAWDLGIGDATAIWIYQVIGHEIHLIEYIQDSNQSLKHYIKLLKEKPYTFEKHFVPHDAKAREYTSGLTREEVARNLGIIFTVAPRLSIAEGIDAVKNILSRCWFDERKCQKGILALENYKRRWNSTLGCWDEKPLHDNASHGADAFRILAISAKHVERKGMTKEDLDSLKRRSLYSTQDFF